MAALPPIAQIDPTLEAADRAMEAIDAREPKRRYLGMSSIGHPCGRKLYYDYHTDNREVFDAATLRRFSDGHRTEELVIQRLRLVPGLTWIDVDPETGRQLRLEAFDGRFAGHMDGAVLGLHEAPATWHVGEIKCVNPKKFADFQKIKREQGSKATLKLWDPVYYAQGMAYCGHSGMTRHWMVVTTPGGRDWCSVRTDFDPVAFAELNAKALRIIEARAPLARIAHTPDWWQCKFCGHRQVCWEGKAA